MSIKKVIIILVVLLVVAGIVAGTIYKSQQNVIKVTTQTAGRQDLVAIISGTGQIKPKTYVNIGATAFGRITHLEGERRRPRQEGPDARHAREHSARGYRRRPAGHHRLHPD